MTPRTAEEITAHAAAQLVAQSELTDLAEGGVAHTLLGVMGVQLAQVEARVHGLLGAFYLGGRGVDLDTRVQDLPIPQRAGPTPASGRGVYLRRADVIGPLTVPAGVMLLSPSNGLEYATTEPATFAAGEERASADVRVVCTTLGAEGNVGTGALSVVTWSPNPNVVGVSNTQVISGGSDGETDEALAWRAQRWVDSMSRVSVGALEVLGRTFQSSDGTRARFAFLVEDPLSPGYSELVVDDGTGFQGGVRAGAAVTEVVPADGLFEVRFDGPAVGTPTFSRAPLLVIPERGVAYYDPDNPPMGGVVSVSNYQVYTGFIAELQAEVEASYRAAGSRVRVVPPTLEYFHMRGLLVVKSGFDYNAVRQQVIDGVFAFAQANPPGSPIIAFQLCANLQKIPGVLDVRLQHNQNIHPSNRRAKLYPMADGVRFNA